MTCTSSPPLVVKGEPPEFIFKDFHEIPAQREDSSTPPATLQPTPDKKRKTRNSNGTRGAARPGLRSAKTYTEKNDSDDDEGTVCVCVGGVCEGVGVAVRLCVQDL